MRAGGDGINACTVGVGVTLGVADGDAFSVCGVGVAVDTAAVQPVMSRLHSNSVMTAPRVLLPGARTATLDAHDARDDEQRDHATEDAVTGEVRGLLGLVGRARRLDARVDVLRLVVVDDRRGRGASAAGRRVGDDDAGIRVAVVSRVGRGRRLVEDVGATGADLRLGGRGDARDRDAERTRSGEALGSRVGTVGGVDLDGDVEVGDRGIERGRSRDRDGVHARGDGRAAERRGQRGRGVLGVGGRGGHECEGNGECRGSEHTQEFA